jgi:TM2 domain-containing membrane protein YozV
MEEKSGIVAFLLSLFFGYFGADWFYLSDGNATYILIGININSCIYI